MKIRFLYSAFLLSIWFAIACKTYYPTKTTTDLLKIEKSLPADTALISFYKPYKDSLDKAMNIKVATLESDLFKKQPESTLGNLMADIVYKKTSDYLKTKIDFAVMNYGGIRVNSLSKGDLRIENAYLISPFDNYLVVQNLSGAQVHGICDSIAKLNGWPVSGISFVIKNKKAEQIKIQQIPLDENKIYSMATIDYIANGGDGMAFLKNIPQTASGILCRDAILDYWKEQTQKGLTINAQLENRITHVE